MDSKSITCNITSRYLYIIYCSSQQKKKYIYCPIRNVSFEEILLQLEIGDHGIPSFSIPFPQQTKKQVNSIPILSRIRNNEAAGLFIYKVCVCFNCES